MAPEWGWAWPANRRILYNRASADPDGKPWSERKAYVWWDAGRRAASGPATTCRTSRRPSRRRTAPPEGADGVAGDRGRRPVHHAGRRQGLALRAAGAASTGRCRRTTSRSSRRSATRCTASRPTRPARSTDRDDNRMNPSPPERARRGLPLRLHDQPAHRAPHRRRDEPLPGAPRRAAAGDVRRGLARAGRRARAWSTSAGATWSPPAPAIEGRVLVTDRLRPLRVGGPDRPPGLAALPLGRRRPGHRRLGQRPVRHHAGPERADPGEQGRHLRRTARPPADRRGPAGVRRGYAQRAGWPTMPTRRSSRRPPTRRRSRPGRSTPDDETSRRTTRDGPQQPLRAARPGAGRRLRRRPAADGVLHRHQRLHRLQGVRGGLQGVERRPRRRLRHARDVLRQHRLAQRQHWRHVAFIEQPRERPAGRAAVSSSGMPAVRRRRRAT